MTTIERHIEEWTYLGKVISAKGTLCINYETEEWVHLGDAKWKETRSYKRGGLPSFAQPGSVWRVTVDDGGLYYKGANKPQYLRMIDDPERCVQLQATSRAAEIEIRMEKQAKNDMSASEIDKLLEPLREEYAKRNRVGKAALLATIYEKIGLI